ncbi:phospholipid carrier-dependent glycosyltransferase [Actinomyces sp. 186855]|nr:phospholipid carrier-dependent glycosyltransferase [Actinomyces sp. AC-20-1]MCL3789717.1 phospholipid carrier-dependent glycosyltransferase [Actinomyces sp. 187325]MCL3792074.1 phospholipid carrier-dependent glycosyltransferase [Actinomyces sp. 186855]MCL3794747.1 phospholipid carrier-dependent glycosyltransferase [Actinomyces sp. 217892]
MDGPLRLAAVSPDPSTVSHDSTDATVPETPPAADGGEQNARTAEDLPSGTGATEDVDSTRTEEGLRELLGLDPLGWSLAPAVRLRGWVATGVVTLVAALTRLIGLGHPNGLMFDEIYYVKDAYALWHNGYESVWTEGADRLFEQGDASGLTTEASFIVHPQLGKWLIALGMQLFGADSAVGWRFMPAVAGVLTVLLLARLTMRLTRSPLLAGLAGLLLAIDGVGITESRIALLDVFVGFFGLASVYLLVRDREWFHARLACGLAGTVPGAWAPLPLLRPWLLAAGLCAGLTCSIKWSGAYLLAAMGIMVVVWDLTALRRVHARSWLADGVLHRGVLDFLHLVPTAFVVYVVNWWSWFAHVGAYKHGWAAEQRAAGTPVRAWLPDPLNDLFEYHQSMYAFHVGLDSEHPYMAKPTGWLVQWRPTSFFWPSEEDLGFPSCGGGRCVQAITSIGNIPIWWAAVLALVLGVIVLAGIRRDWRVWVALVGYLGLYLPWFFYWDRTIFTFYTVAFVPYVVLVLVLALGTAAGLLRSVPGSAEARREERLLAAGEIGPGLPAPRGAVARYLGFGMRPMRRGLPEAWSGAPVWRTRGEGYALMGVLVVAAVVFAVLWWPIWTGQTVSYEFWHRHMLFDSWI